MSIRLLFHGDRLRIGGHFAQGKHVRPAFSRARLLAAGIFCGVCARAIAEPTNLYHYNVTNILFEATNLPAGTPTVSDILKEEERLERLVGPFNVQTNAIWAKEYETVAWGYPNAPGAWTTVLGYYSPYNWAWWPSCMHTNHFFDNVGWVKGVRSVPGPGGATYGASLWLLQNTIQFTSSTTDVYVSSAGVTSSILRVQVGSLGDYNPSNRVTDIGPTLDTNYPGLNMFTTRICRADTRAFYKLPLKAMIPCNDGDLDGDSIPDFADGFNWDGTASNDDATTNAFFQPWKLTLPAYVDVSNTLIKFEYSNSPPTGVTRTGSPGSYIYTPATGTLRVWTRSARLSRDKRPVLQGGHFVEATGYKATDLGFTPDKKSINLFVEGIRPSTNQPGTNQSIRVTYSHKGAPWLTLDAVNPTVIKVDLDTDTDNDGTIDADDSGEDLIEEYWPGRILSTNGFGVGANIDYLTEIKLKIQPTLASGTAKLEALTNGSCIKVWTTTNKTEEVTLPKTYDLATTNPPSVLYVDGITTGKVQLALSYTAGSGGFTCTDRVAMLTIPTVSYAPLSSNAYVWFSEPLLGDVDGIEFENQLTDEGFRVTWFCDLTGKADTDFGQCTLANYKNMTNAGAFTVISHGDIGEHLVVYAEDTASGQAACDAWRNGDANLITRHYPGSHLWCVVANSSWLTANWQSGMNANRAIAMWSICYSAAGNPSVKEAAGGRWRSGYELPTHGIETRDVNRRLLSRMNGSSDNGGLRCAQDAWNENTLYDWRTFGGWDFDDNYDTVTDRWVGSVKMDGNGWTTLCPAPIATNAMFPDIAIGNRTGWGCIIFDTYMCNTNAPDDALLKTAGCPTSDHRWLGNINGFYGIGFDYDKTGGGATTMRALADKCRNDGGEGRKMDGNRATPPYGTDCEWSY